MRNSDSKRPRRARQRHRWPDSVMRQVLELRRLDNWHAIVALAWLYLMIAAAIALPYAVERAFGMGWWLTYPVSVIVVGLAMRGLATCLHESAHRTFCKNKRWNFVAGTYFSGYLILQSWHAYYLSHVPGHHVNLGDPEKDPDHHYLLSLGAYDALPRWLFVWRFLLAPLLLLRNASKLADLFRYRFFAAEEPLRDRLCKCAFLAAIVGAACWSRLGLELLLFWAVPFVTTFPVVNWFIELSEHYPYVGETDRDVEMSRNRWTGWGAKLCLGMLNESYHQVHHLFPWVPWFNLPKAHRILMADPVYRASQHREVGFAVPIIGGVPSVLSSLLEGCDRKPPSA